MQQQFFPLSERPELFVDLRLRQGCVDPGDRGGGRSEAEKLLAGDKTRRPIPTYIGKGRRGSGSALQPAQPNESFAQIVIVARGRRGARAGQGAAWRRAVAKARSRRRGSALDRLNFGPPVGFPVQFRVIGPDPDEVRDIADQVRDVMRADRRLVDAQLDWSEKMPSIGSSSIRRAPARSA